MLVAAALSPWCRFNKCSPLTFPLKFKHPSDIEPCPVMGKVHANSSSSTQPRCRHGQKSVKKHRNNRCCCAPLHEPEQSSPSLNGSDSPPCAIPSPPPRDSDDDDWTNLDAIARGPPPTPPPGPPSPTTPPTTSSTSPPELELRPCWHFEHWKPGPSALEAFAAQQRSEARGDYQKRKEELWKAKDIREWAEYKLKLLTSSKKRHL